MSGTEANKEKKYEEGQGYGTGTGGTGSTGYGSSGTHTGAVSEQSVSYNMQSMLTCVMMVYVPRLGGSLRTSLTLSCVQRCSLVLCLLYPDSTEACGGCRLRR